jgi:hypothetical protein
MCGHCFCLGCSHRTFCHWPWCPSSSTQWLALISCGTPSSPTRGDTSPPPVKPLFLLQFLPPLSPLVKFLYVALLYVQQHPDKPVPYKQLMRLKVSLSWSLCVPHKFFGQITPVIGKRFNKVFSLTLRLSLYSPPFPTTNRMAFKKSKLSQLATALW